MELLEKVDELLEKDWDILDFLPVTVPRDCGGNYFEIEEYFLTERNKEFASQVTEFLLKLNCYVDFVVVTDKAPLLNPSPRNLVKKVKKCYKSKELHLNILLENRESLLVCHPHFLHLALYAPSAYLADLCRALCQGQGFYYIKSPG